MVRAIKAYVRYVDAFNRRIGRMTMYLIFAMMGILLYSSITKTFFPFAAMQELKLTDVVVLPTPPFWFATATVFAIISLPETSIIYSLFITFHNS